MESPLRHAGQSFRKTYAIGLAAIRLLWSEADGYVCCRLGLTVLLVFAASLLAVAAPMMFKAALDDIGAGGAEPSLTIPVFLMLAYVSAQWLARGVDEIRGLLHGGAEHRLVRRLSVKIFTHLLALPLQFHLDRKSGALGRTLANGIVGFRIVLEHAVFALLPAIVQVTAMAAVLGHFYRPAFLVILGLAVFAYLIVFGIGAARVAAAVRAASAAEIDAAGIVADGLINLETVKSFTAEQRIRTRFDEALRRCEAQWLRFHRRRSANGLLVATVFALSLGSALLIAGREVARGTMTIGDFVLVNAYILQLVAPLEMLGAALRDIAQGTAFIEKVLSLMGEEPERSAARRSMPHGGRSGEIVFEDVSFAYGPGRLILEDISLRIPAGAAVAIVGESGVGKSTIVRLLLRLVEPDKGRILLDGVPITDLSPRALRETIAVVPQDTTLFNDTIAENIAFGAPPSASGRIARAAALARIDGLVARLPNGYETQVGERGLKLSGGEKQRVAIARAVFRSPKVFVFDEATSSLDSRTEREIVTQLATMSRGTTRLLIGHKLATLVDVDEILVLEDCRIVERGTHRALISQDGRYAALWRTQIEASAAKS